MLKDLSAKYIDLREMSRDLGITYTGALYRLVTRGALPVYQFGQRGYYAKRSDWAQYMTQGHQK